MLAKTKTYGYRERDEQERQEFLKRLEQIEVKDLVYIDESGIDNREDYPYGYCQRGKRFYALKSGKRTERVSWIAALRSGKVIAPLTFQGSCNRALFETWLEKSLLPQLQPGNVLILDNATFHKSEWIREIVEEAECELWYLPSYSPDLNKIERCWSVLKKWMKQRIHEFEDFRSCVDAAFKECPNVFS